MNRSEYQPSISKLCSTPKRWLVTGAAGFIGSHLVEKLLELNQSVVGLDDFSTGREENLDDVKRIVGADKWRNFSLIKGDIRNLEICCKAVRGCDFVLHQAALGSVPRSIADPITTNAVNVDGFVNLLLAASEVKIRRFVYASSSSVYGDSEKLPKAEQDPVAPLSPYAVSKYVGELYAGVFASTHGIDTIGLRYFNVFGPRQDPAGAYAAVIPRWIAALKEQKECVIFGDGTTSRDFCYVDNVVQANLLAATTDNAEALNRIFNVAVGGRCSLNELYTVLAESVVAQLGISVPVVKHEDFRSGDVKHSQGEITLAHRYLGYTPTVKLEEGLKRTVKWFLQ